MVKRLLKLESVKLLNYTSAKVLLALHLGLFVMGIFVISQVKISVPGFSTDNLFRFPHIWQVTAWVASWFNLLLAILVMMISCNEYAFKTFRQNLIDGLSRKDLFIGKSLVIMVLAVYAFILVVVVSVVMGIIFTGEYTIAAVFSNFHLAGIYFIQAIGYMFLGLLFANVFKNAALSIVGFLVVRLVLEPIIRTFFNPAIRPFFPMKMITGLTPMPEILTITSDIGYTQSGKSAFDLSEIGLISSTLPLSTNLFVALAYIGVFALGSWYILQKRDF